MNSKLPVPDEKEDPDHLYQTPMLDPFGELRTIPSGWDLSEMLCPSRQPADNHVEAKNETGCLSPAPAEATAESPDRDLFGLDYPGQATFPTSGGMYSFL